MSAFDNGSEKLKTLPLYPDPSAQTPLYAKQRQEIAARGEYVKRYKNRNQNSGERDLDPVLKYHLGLADDN